MIALNAMLVKGLLQRLKQLGLIVAVGFVLIAEVRNNEDCQAQ